MDSDSFVEEFDTSSESDSGESLAKQPKLMSQVITPGPSYSFYQHQPPPPQPDNLFSYPAYQGFGLSPYNQQGQWLPNPNPSATPCNNNDFQDLRSFAYASENICLDIPEGREPEIPQRRKKRRNRKNVKLSDYDDSVRSFAWRIYQKKKLESKLEMCRDEKESLQITQSLEAIKEDLSNSTTVDINSQDESGTRKIVNKIKSQRRKRLREKLGRMKKCEEKQKNFELKKKREAEIDTWLKDQGALFEAENKHRLFVKEQGQKSLAEILKKKGMIEDRLKLLFNLQKLREIRKKQMMNTQPGFSPSSMVTSDRVFFTKTSKLLEILHISLTQIQEEEKVIRVRMTPPPKSQTLIVSTALTSDTGAVDDVQNRKLKRQKKWEKWLRKKKAKVGVPLTSFSCPYYPNVP